MFHIQDMGIHFTSRSFPTISPMGVTKLFLLKLARSWYGTDSGRKELPSLIVQLTYMILVAWGGWKAWKRGGVPRLFVLTTFLVMVYFWSMTFLALSIFRYMVPANGLLFVMVAGVNFKEATLPVAASAVTLPPSSFIASHSTRESRLVANECQ
jgi:hypothetical protein